MQNPSDADEARRLAAEERATAHLTWKRDFFHARPPPPPIGRLHRRQRGPKGGPPVRVTLKRAREIVAEERRRTAEEAAAQAAPPDMQGDSEEPLTKRGVWLRRMWEEEERRKQVVVDFNVVSNASKTTIMANLPQQAVEEDLRRFANQFGQVVSVRIVRNAVTGRSRRYAFVEFNLVGEAKAAVKFSRKKRLGGHAVTIDMEQGRTVPGFLPKRLATAKALRDASRVTGRGPADAAGASPRSGGAGTGTVVDDEDALLASILGGST